MSAPHPGAVVAAMDDTVAAYRKIIVLMDDAAALDEGNRERVRTAAWILFEKNRERLENLEQDLRADLATKDAPLNAAFLTRLETNADFRDADKLAFRDVLDGLASVPPAQEAPALRCASASPMMSLFWNKSRLFTRRKSPRFFPDFRRAA